MGEQNNYKTIMLEDGAYETLATAAFKRRKPYEKQNPNIIKAFIPGQITDILIKPGAQVFKGDTILILEAMKMRNKVKAPVNGRLKSISVKTGEKVMKDQVILEIE